MLNSFLGMAHLHLYLFSHVVESLAHERLEKINVFKYVFIRLLQILFLHLPWQVSNEISLLIIVEIFPQTG